LGNAVAQAQRAVVIAGDNVFVAPCAIDHRFIVGDNADARFERDAASSTA
jgi:hypothetical protein